MLAPGQFERRLTAVGTVAVLAAVAFFGMLAYWQVFRTDLETEDRNPRVLSTFSDPNRGRLLDRDGNVLAESLPDGSRHYTDASVAHVLGYIDPRYGSQGAELAFNGYLAGQEDPSWRGAVDRELLRERTKGDDVRLTIDPKVQAAAASALGERKGAVVALNPKTGEVLAMVSVPTYDPGSLATNGETLFDDPNAPLLNRATQGLYPPGSTFKTVTATSALENGVMKPETEVTCPGEIAIDGFSISCANTPQGVGTYSFQQAFANSVNAIFAQVGVKVGWARLEDTARRYGFGSALPFDLATATTQLTPDGADRTRVLLASTAFGQGKLLATPLQMAVVAATIANGGLRIDPHIGLGVDDGNGNIMPIESPGSTRVVDPAVAETMRQFMVSAVSGNQANGVAIPGVTVAGKTGTAETGVEGVSHAWFIGFAPADDPVIAVAVVVENGGRGGEVAAPIGGAVLRAGLGK